MPGFTHLQSAQPVTFGHHLLAYVEMLARDRGRFADARRRMNECPLGAAALAGTSFPIDRAMTAKALGFDRPTANSLDSVSDRDFVLETLAAASICAMHLSRFAEEIVLWTTPQFGFVKLSDKFTTGSSIMPQKRNPDAAELVRAKAGRIVGALNGLLDGDEGPAAHLWEGHAGGQGGRVRRARHAVAVRRRDRRHGARHGARPRAHAGRGRRRLRDRDRSRGLAGRTLKLPFREAHHITGRIVAAAEQAGVSLEELPLAEMQSVDPRITKEVFAVLGSSARWRAA